MLNMPGRGRPNFEIHPGDAQSDDLCVLVLCYASKIRWLLETEQPILRTVLDRSLREALVYWEEPGSDLISRMPSGLTLEKSVRSDAEVKSGERFVIKLHRRGAGTSKARSWVSTSIPRPGLAANLPLSVLYVLNGVFSILSQSDRARLRDALQRWHNEAFADEGLDKTIAGLRSLFKLASTCWESSQ
jgi:hypothetical protein